MVERGRPAIVTLLAAALGLAGCATTEAPPSIPVTDGSLLDDYVIAHGFAAGRVLSADADRQTVLTVVQLDHAALLALSISAAHPTDRDALRRAQDAIAALTTFVARSSEPEHRS